MEKEFTKYSATGNDFIIFDNRDEALSPKQTELWQKLCLRREGVGADGVILFQNSEKYDFKMIYVNADGSLGEMCGNGGRATTHFAYQVIGLKQNHYTFETTNSVYQSEFTDPIKLKMTELYDWGKVDLSSFSEYSFKDYLNTGVPHVVFLVNQLDKYDVKNIGREIRQSALFSQGANVNFFRIVEPGKLQMRTYERGVEAETLSCGTGVTATVLAYAKKENFSRPVTVLTKGGELKVEFSSDYKNVYLCGKVENVFKGMVQI